MRPEDFTSFDVDETILDENCDVHGVEDLTHLPATLKKDALKAFDKDVPPLTDRKYLVYFCEWRGMLCQRVFALKAIKCKSKKGGYHLYAKEIFRTTETETWWSDCYEQHYIAGWSTHNFGKASILVPQHPYYERYKREIPGGMLAYNELEDPTIRFAELLPKYFTMNNFQSIYDHRRCKNFWDFLERWKSEPALEIYTKMGFAYMYRDKRFLRKDKKWVSYLRKNREAILKERPNYTTIRRAMSMAMTLGEYEEWSIAKYTAEYIIKEGLYMATIEDGYEVVAYLDTKQRSIQYYTDYLSAAKILGMNLFDKGVAYPRDLVKAHDTVTQMAKVEEANIKAKAVAEQITKAKLPEKVRYKDADVKVVKEFEELTRVGNELKNCVAHAPYYDKMSRGESFILEVTVKGELKNCVEISKRLKVLQNYGFHNQESDCQALAEKAVEKYVRAARLARKEVVATV